MSTDLELTSEEHAAVRELKIQRADERQRRMERREGLIKFGVCMAIPVGACGIGIMANGLYGLGIAACCSVIVAGIVGLISIYG